jgi:hypothetical protein
MREIDERPGPLRTDGRFEASLPTQTRRADLAARSLPKRVPVVRDVSGGSHQKKRSRIYLNTARCAVDAVSTATAGLGVGLGEAGLAGSEFLSASELADLAEPLGVFADIGLAGYGGGLGLGAVAMPGSDKKCSPQ